MDGIAQALASVLYPNSGANSMYSIAGKSIASQPMVDFKNPWANALAGAVQPLLGAGLQAYGQYAANKANAENAAQVLPQLSNLGVTVTPQMQEALLSGDVGKRNLALAVAEKQLQTAEAQKESAREFQKFARQEVFKGLLASDPSARKAALQTAAGIGLVDPTLVSAASSSGQTPYEKALEMTGDPAVARDLVKQGVDAQQKQQEALVKQAQSLDFVNSQFEDAKKIPTLNAMLPRSRADSQLAGIQTNLRTHLQKMIGREMNGPEQEKLMVALPSWTDSVKQIDEKKSRFIDLINQMTQPTTSPAFVGLSNIGQQAPQMTQAVRIPVGTQSEGAAVAKVGDSQLAQINAEQARAILRARGVAGY